MLLIPGTPPPPRSNSPDQVAGLPLSCRWRLPSLSAYRRPGALEEVEGSFFTLLCCVG